MKPLVSDDLWAVVAPLPPTGRPAKDHRPMIEGVLWRLRTGAPGRDLPPVYGPWQSVYTRFRRWRRDGTWDRLLSHVQTRSDAGGDVVWDGWHRHSTLGLLAHAFLDVTRAVANGTIAKKQWSCVSSGYVGSRHG